MASARSWLETALRYAPRGVDPSKVGGYLIMDQPEATHFLAATYMAAAIRKLDGFGQSLQGEN